MRVLPALVLATVVSVLSAAEPPFQAVIIGTVSDHEVSWPTRSGYNYQLFLSPDLVNFVDMGIVEPGNGSIVTYVCRCDDAELYYRVHETLDPYNGGFLDLPEHDQEFEEIDGVCFAFDLNEFAALPAKIRIYKRVFGSGLPWEQIGAITDFDEIDGIKFVRGSCVWIPDLPEENGVEIAQEYEVKAAVVDGAGTVIASAVRMIEVKPNTLPSVTITSGPDTPSTDDDQQPLFGTSVSSDVVRVEFFDNGVFVGSDSVAPFGDELIDANGDVNISYRLGRGLHQITAKAYNSRGLVGETAVPFEVLITAGNAQPKITLVTPSDGQVFQEGQTFDVTFDLEDADGASDISDVWIARAGSYALYSAEDWSPPFDGFTVDTTGWPAGTHKFVVQAYDHADVPSYYEEFSIIIKEGAGPSFAEKLVGNIVKGDGTAVPEAETFVGIHLSSDEFTDGQRSGLEIDEGIILTSGSAGLWNAGDEYEDAGEIRDLGFPDYTEPGDPLLEDRVAGLDSNDAAILEFDVDCLHGQLELEYQFGSDEYVEYVSDRSIPGYYNDGFAVWVDGVAVSLTPDCLDIVSAHSVHPAIEVDDSAGRISNNLPARNAHLYIDDDEIDAALDPADQATQLEYDGVTIRLRIHAFVTPGEKHRVRISIADVNGGGVFSFDDLFDSGLFVGKSSLGTTEPSP